MKILKQNEDTVADIDENVYHTITIGTQVWMAENLETTKYNDGTPIRYERGAHEWYELREGALCWYDNYINYKNQYGALYNWYAVETGKLAPKGWHVPSREEWDILRDYLIANGYNYDGTTKDNRIAKSLASTSGWKEYDEFGSIGNNQSFNNVSGFTALPSGRRYNGGKFALVGDNCAWWSTSMSGTIGAYARGLSYECSVLLYGGESIESGLSVRCIRNN